MRSASLYVLSAILVVVIAILAVLLFGLEGTPSATTQADGGGQRACEGMTGDALKQCIDARAREVESSTGSTGRAARGSGVEGVTSGGTIIDPPGGY